MLKKSITFTDFNGKERTEDFYFNLTKAELLEMELSAAGGMGEKLKKIVRMDNQPELIKAFKELILNSYGEKSEDGRRFIKNDELRESFAQTEAYSNLFVELSSNADAAAEFVNGLIPADLAAQVAKMDTTNLAALID